MIKNIDIASSRNFLLKEGIGELDEMAMITGDLKDAIKKVINANKELEGLALKKAIKADQAVIDALGEDDLYDNQLNKFIGLVKGTRDLQQRGRKPLPKDGDAPINEMAKIAGELKSAIEAVINGKPELDGLALKKAIKSDPAVLAALGDEKLHDNQLNGFISSVKGAPSAPPKTPTDVAQDDIVDDDATGWEIPTDEEDVVDTWNTPDEDDEEDLTPTTSDIDPTIAADVPSDESGVSAANTYKNIIVRKVNKIEAMPSQERAKSVDMMALKKFIAKPEVTKALTVPTIRDLVSSIIG